MKVFRYLFFLLLLVVSSTIVLFYAQFSGPQKKSEKERFVIRLNTSEEQVIDDLKEKGFIKNKTIFKFILNFVCWQKKNCFVFLSPIGNNFFRRIKPGAYLISKKMNVYELAKILVAGPYQRWVVIPPGKRKEQIALILQKSLNWPFSTARDFSNLAEEGYLYPETYLIDTDAIPERVMQKLRTSFNEKFDERLQHDLLTQNIRNDTAIKIASLIERESGGNEDKPIIAGIIWNRLSKGMKLEIDATVQYAIVSGTLSDVGFQDLNDFIFWPQLGAGVVRTIDSAYNTYLNKGLPPGPICSPSLESIRAVAYPAKTDALYYLHSPDKQIHTAKTLKEHEENIVKYLR